MRVAIVNDLVMAVEALRRVVASDPSLELAWIARDGAQAVEKCAADTPDLVLMDLIMPVMDGVEATRRIMAASPCAILVVTATVEGNASKVFDAMSHGALDAVNTPVLGAAGEASSAADLLAKIAIIGRLIEPPRTAPASLPRLAEQAPLHEGRPPLVAIGASTGGPAALAAVLSRLPAEFPGAVVVVQHVDEEFAAGLASWLDLQTSLAVRVAEVGDTPRPTEVLVAASNDHLVLTAGLTLDYRAEPVDNPYRPSVDVFFHTVAAYWPERGVAVSLTGMGADGATGMLELRHAGWHTIAQDEASSLIFGMPRACIEAGAAAEVTSLSEMGRSVVIRVETLAAAGRESDAVLRSPT